MALSLTGVVVGALFGLVQGLMLAAFFRRIEAQAIRGLDADGVAAKRALYGPLRTAVVVVETLLFAIIGGLVWPLVVG